MKTKLLQCTLPAKKPLKNPKLFFNLKLDKDTNEGSKSTTKEEVNSEIKEEFHFIITNQLTDKLIIEYKNESDKNKLISKCTEVFEKLSQGNNSIVIEELWKKCNLRKHPLVTIFGRKPDYAKKKLEEAINFSAVGGNSINLKEFIELHKNMYALLPPDNQKYFLNLIPEMWGVA